ncbi:hypothetical protein I6N96_09090 [Enterococcus sp. BWM-S5]|uniref:Uncharacterized protein n=1 Tax=Enterococcus larvae TaxID=2794352 RepID=A0ABS4CJ25_9ENTE|nr:hypothetical protein [Enterococcus larvae]MBP1046438.1 hypothetical protein [Enterococcus larvae]
MTAQTLHFTVDPYWLIRFMLQRHHEKHYHGNDEHTKAVRFALSDLLYDGKDSLTNDELYQIAENYFGKESKEFLLEPTEEQSAGMFQIVLKMPRFEEKVWEYTLKGYGKYEYSVIDLNTRVERKTRFAHHYETLIEVLGERYADKFNEMSQKEKDDFIMNNFKLIGKRNSMSWYTPTYPV